MDIIVLKEENAVTGQYYMTTRKKMRCEMLSGKICILFSWFLCFFIKSKIAEY